MTALELEIEEQTGRDAAAMDSTAGARLGLDGIKSRTDLAAAVEKCLPTAAIGSLVRSGLTDAEVYSLIVPRRTLTHRVANRQPLSKDESDRAVRVARIVSMAEQVFGEPERAWSWLRKPKQRFHGRTPIETLDTEAGARLVEQLLVQIDHGMAA